MASGHPSIGGIEIAPEHVRAVDVRRSFELYDIREGLCKNILRAGKWLWVDRHTNAPITFDDNGNYYSQSKKVSLLSNAVLNREFPLNCTESIFLKMAAKEARKLRE